MNNTSLTKIDDPERGFCVVKKGRIHRKRKVLTGGRFCQDAILWKIQKSFEYIVMTPIAASLFPGVVNVPLIPLGVWISRAEYAPLRFFLFMLVACSLFSLCMNLGSSSHLTF